MAEQMEMNEAALKFCARLVNAMVDMRQELGRTYTELDRGGWEGYDYSGMVDQLLDEADAFGEDE